jgi:hypothetical protein
MKCEKCGHYMPPPKASPPKSKWPPPFSDDDDLAYMVRADDFIFAGTLIDEKWKNDAGMCDFVAKGFVAMNEKLGFKATPKAREYLMSKGWNRNMTAKIR